MKQHPGNESSNPNPSKQVHGQYTNVGKKYAPPPTNIPGGHNAGGDATHPSLGRPKPKSGR